MPAKVHLGPSTPSIRQTSFVLIPRRESVLATLRSGERLDVEVLQKFTDGNVLLKLKGASVTARTTGEMNVGDRMSVRVERDGTSYVLRRLDTQDDPAMASLVKVVRSRLGGMAERSVAISTLARNGLLAALGGSKSGLAALLSRTHAVLAETLTVSPGLAEKLMNLAVLFGLSPATVGERLREALGRNLPGLLQRILSSSSKEWAAVLKEAPNMSTDDVGQLTRQFAQVKEQIGLFRALNALLESRGQPVYLSLPFILNGEAQPADIWIYKDRDAKRSEHSASTSTAFVKLRLSNLGEVRALIAVTGQAVNATIYTSGVEVAERVRAALPELTEGLQAEGLSPQVAVREDLTEAPEPDLTQMLYGTAEGSTLNVRA